MDGADLVLHDVYSVYPDWMLSKWKIPFIRPFPLPDRAKISGRSFRPDQPDTVEHDRLLCCGLLKPAILADPWQRSFHDNVSHDKKLYQ